MQRPRKQPYLMSLAPGLALLLLATPHSQCLGQGMPSSGFDKSYSFALKDYAKPVRFALNRMEDGSVCASYDEPNSDQHAGHFIYEVDNYKTRDRFLFEIARHVAGRSDTSVTMKLLRTDLRESAVTLTRVSSFRPGSSYNDSYFARELTSSDEDNLKAIRDGFTIRQPTDSSLSGGLESLADAYRNIDLEANHPYKSSTIALNAAYNCAFLALKRGDLKQAEKYSKLIQAGDELELAKIAKNWVSNDLFELSFNARDYSLALKLAKSFMIDAGIKQTKDTIDTPKDNKQWLALFNYAKILHAQRQSQFKQAVDRLYTSSEVFTESDISIPIELSNWLLEQGDRERAGNCLRSINKGCDSALKCLEKEVEISALTETPKIAKGICAYADFEINFGKPEKAIKSYSALINFFEKHLTEEKYINLERIDSTSPRYSEICKGLARAYEKSRNHIAANSWLKRAMSVLERAQVTYVPEYIELKELLDQANERSLQANLESTTKQKDIHLANEESVSAQLKVTEQELFDLLRQAYQELEQKDETDCWEALDKLLVNYKAQGRMKESKLDFYWCLSEFARRASDLGSYNVSDKLLHELACVAPLLERNTGVLGWIEIEQQVNICRKKSSNADWSKIIENELFEEIRPAERCRLIAQKYLRAQDYARARIFADKALELANKDINQKILGLLTSCSIFMKASLLEQSQESDSSQKIALAQLTEAVHATCDYKPYDEPQRILSFEKQYRLMLGRTARIAAETKFAGTALPILELASKQLPSEHERIAKEISLSSDSKIRASVVNLLKADVDKSDKRPLFYLESDYSASELAFGMAQCFIKLGRYDEAYKLLSQSALLTDTCEPRSELERAKLAIIEARGTAKEKHALYSEIIGNKELADSELAEKLISAYSTKLKEINQPQEDLTASALYNSLKEFFLKTGVEFGSWKLEEAIPDTHPMRLYLKRITQQVAQTKDKKPPLKNLAQGATDFIFDAVSNEPKAKSVELLYEIALWEAKHGRQEQCLRHSLEAIKETTDPIKLELQSYNIFEIIDCLDTNGATNAADRLIYQYLQFRLKKFGRDYTGYLIDRSKALKRSMKLRREEEASNYLEELLSIEARKVENSFFTDEVSPVVSVALAMGGKISLERQDWFHRNKEMPPSLLKLRLELLYRILHHQTKSLPSDHFCLACTHLAIGEVLAQLGHKKEAHDELESACNILNMYEPFSDFIESVEQFRDRLSAGSEPKNTKEGKTDERSAYEERIRKAAFYRDIANTPLMQETDALDTRERIKLFSQLYQEAKRKAPYCDRCISLLKIIADDYERTGQFNLQASALAELASICKHRNILGLSNRNRKVSIAWSRPNSTNRLEFYRQLIIALKKDNQVEAAKQYEIEAAEFIPSEVRSIEMEALERIRELVH